MIYSTFASTTQNWLFALSKATSLLPNILAIVFLAALRTPIPALQQYKYNRISNKNLEYECPTWKGFSYMREKIFIELNNLKQYISIHIENSISKIMITKDL